MKVVFTARALGDLDEILGYIRTTYPNAFAGFEARMAAAIRRIGHWPESAAQVADRSGVWVVPLIRYPYKIFYRVAPAAIEVLYIHHAARREP
ncbi:MAG: type II toxin-antitoxin system RelE/ParE family toxin [Alphaproteobacteria bacterium]|nr:type II toxin-antitoxin system RelE/ParE family toxin [Alphaproteobacteria bacterium]